MPLRALIDNIEIISTYLNSNEWIELRDKIKQESLDVIISQTDKKGYLRTSKNGLQHFVHKKGEAPEDFKTESPQLLFIKSQDRKSTRLNSSHTDISRMPSSA